MTQAVLKTVYENKVLNRRYPIRLVNEDLCYTPVFCMYAWYSKKYQQSQKFKLPEMIAEDISSYKFAVLITDVKEFLNKINKQLPSFCYSPINYIDYTNLRGKVIFEPIIKKDKYKYGHQQEFRIYDHSIAITRREDFNIPGVMNIPGIENNGNLAEKFSIGNLNDITKIYTLDELLHGVRIELNIDWDYCHKNNLVKNSNLERNNS